MSKILSALHHFAEQRPHEIALRSGQVTNHLNEMTYQELSSAVGELGREFQILGLQRIGLCLDNSIEWIVSDLAALEAGITIVPVPLFFTSGQLNHLMREAQLDALIVDHQWFEDSPLADALTDDFVQSVNKSAVAGFSMIRLKSKQHKDRSKYLQNIAKITYTSGSTGDPKGVCLSADTIEEVAVSLHQAVRSLELKKHLCIMPLATLLENIAGVYVPLLEGCMIHVEPLHDLGLQQSSGLNTAQCVQALEMIRPHSLIALPQFLRLFVALKQQPTMSRALSYLRFIAVGGAKTSVATIQQALDLKLPVYEGYGLSECASVLCLNTPEDYCIGSVGRPLIAGKLELNEEGEVLVKGQVMQGYLSELEKPVEPHNEGLKTGDLAYFDEAGFLFLKGRKKNLIISSFGRNISPEWVESELESAPEIAQCVVFGEGKPYLTAVIVLTSAFTEEEIKIAIRQCNTQLPDYAQVRQWVLADESFSSSNHLLTYNGRPKRAAIYKYYRESLEGLYVDISITPMTSPVF